MTDRAFEPPAENPLAQIGGETSERPPASPSSVAAAPAAAPKRRSFDEVFPPEIEQTPKRRSFDEVFPPDIERAAQAGIYRTTPSPVEDLIFGDTTVNPVARILDAIGEGFRNNWGSEPIVPSKESEDFLKSSGVYNDYKKGQFNVIKAGNEIVGGIGVSGSPGVDDDCVNSGLEKVKDQLQ